VARDSRASTSLVAAVIVAGMRRSAPAKPRVMVLQNRMLVRPVMSFRHSADSGSAKRLAEIGAGLARGAS